MSLQEAQLSQRHRAVLHVTEYFAKAYSRSLIGNSINSIQFNSLIQ